ncbi:UNVERIFIED_ORG: hypothetical protein J2806_003762 [Kosakonia oryzae]|uniref:Toxic protein SymE n=1 Tax=Kosakonia radicincitans TaxID=283686 RepID=A0AAX2EVH0_9ENTR|nr:hypothetical protein [Kosakonia oryzae]SES76565.1 hypothetical protein SAMN03159294_0537 [Kosakonia radicincitans]SFF06640.1 hypothetical protein SAMN03159468_03614 [Kosakonia radicincitans]SFR20983.1 hypothetical protein SAMN03159514_03478 [Kosakonia radicincitans]SFT88838.1 hypothetical protein SAMN03159428_02620 [Kosakonia radicincitans]
MNNARQAGMLLKRYGRPKFTLKNSTRPCSVTLQKFDFFDVSKQLPVVKVNNHRYIVFQLLRR